MNEKPIILASSSPRRIEMMKKHGLNPDICPADIDESLPQEMGMRDAVMFLALKKALHVERLKRSESNDYQASIIIAADTVVYKDGIMGKPADRKDAAAMLTRIKNTSHHVATGVAIIVVGQPHREVFSDVTKVFVKSYTDAELNEYLDTDEPYDKAGAYAIQGIFSKYIDHYQGDFDTVVGFPWSLIASKLDKF